MKPVSGMSTEELVSVVNRQAELLRHVRDVILPFNPKHYFIEQEELLVRGEESYWSEIMHLRRTRDSLVLENARLRRELEARK